MAECMYWKEVTVNWGESDPFGLVYYPRIVAWFNDTEHDPFRTIGYPIHPATSVNIDTPDDWRRAEALLAGRH